MKYRFIYFISSNFIGLLVIHNAREFLALTHVRMPIPYRISSIIRFLLLFCRNRCKFTVTYRFLPQYYYKSIICFDNLFLTIRLEFCLQYYVYDIPNETIFLNVNKNEINTKFIDLIFIARASRKYRFMLNIVHM